MAGVFGGREHGSRRARGGGVRLLALVVVLALLGAACNGGEDAPDEAAGDDIDLVAFCEGAIEAKARSMQGPELDDEGNPTEESLEQLRDDMAPLIADMEANIPVEIRSQVVTVLAGVRAGLDTGDPEAFMNPAFFEADAAIDEYVFENCELENREEFVAVDFEYQELPETLGSGRIAFRMDNQGSEVHEAAVVRINDDVDLTLRELLDLGHEEGEQMIEFKGVTFAGPGDTGYGVMDLEPGRYGFVCFIPVGTTSLEALFEEGGDEQAPPGAEPTEESPAEGDEPGEDEGPPAHFTQGMFAEVTVS